eukprot:IDg20314t1
MMSLQTSLLYPLPAASRNGRGNRAHEGSNLVPSYSNVWEDCRRIPQESTASCRTPRLCACEGSLAGALGTNKFESRRLLIYITVMYLISQTV